MATAATVAAVAAATATVASAGTSIAASAGAFDSGGGAGGTQTIPLTPQAQSAQNFAARLFAANALQTPPSFKEFIESGGEAKFPILPFGLTPEEATQLGLTGKAGEIPFFDPTEQTQLTPDQLESAGRERLAKGKFRKRAKIFAKREKKIEKRQAQVESGKLTPFRQEKAEKRLDQLLKRQAKLVKRTGILEE